MRSSLTRVLEHLVANITVRGAPIAVLLIFGSAPSEAQFNGALRIAWSDCRGTGGQALETFACNTNATNAVTQHALVSSCIAPDGLTSLASAEMLIEVYLRDPATPVPWWQLGGDGCRPPANRVVSYTNPTDAGCFDYWNKIAGGANGLATYTYPSGVCCIPGLYPCYARLSCAVSVDPLSTQSTTPTGTDLYLATIVIKNGSTESCGGCQIPACIAFTYCRLGQSNGVDVEYNDLAFQRGAPNQVAWQDPSACELGPDIPIPTCYPTQTRATSWGAIKAIYR